MPLDPCEPCCDPDVWGRNTTTYQQQSLRILCAILATGAANGTIEGEPVVLLDDTQEFLRQYIYTNGVVTSVVNTELDGVTPYVPIGIVESPVKPDGEILVLCDTVQQFLRRYEYIFRSTGVDTLATDTELDGTTAYVPIGAVTLCPGTFTASLAPAAFEPLDTTPFGAITAAFVPIGVLTSGSARKFTFHNTTDAALEFSFDGGVSSNAYMPPESTREFSLADLGVTSSVDPEVRYLSVAPTFGALYSEAIK